MPMLQIKRMPVGQIGTNCYLLEDTEAKTCAVIDPGDQPDDIDREIRKAGLKLTMILITHGHFDHVLGVPGLFAEVARHPCLRPRQGGQLEEGRGPVHAPGPGGGHPHREGGGHHRLRRHPHPGLSTPPATPRVGDLPGGDVLFCGDTLFAGSCGRTDFVGGKLWPDPPVPEAAGLPGGNLRVCPGHEGTSTLDVERTHNPFVREAPAMNLYFTGHGEKYAVEQTLLTLFPRSGRCTPTRPLGGQ